MKFLNLFHKSQQHNFDSISEYDDLKEIIVRVLDSDENFNLLLVEPPASSKTLFLLGIMELDKKAIYFDATNTTNRILDVFVHLFESIRLL
jgi:hypothetical protein